MTSRRGVPGPRALPALIGVAAVVGSYIAVRSGAADPVDARVEAALARPVPRRGDAVLGMVTDLGSSFALAGMSAGLLATGHRRLAGEVAAAGGAAWLLAQAVKPALGRTRPYQRGTAPRLVAPPAGSSWPSGHAALAAATAVALGRGAGPPAVLLAAAAVGVGASRVAVGVHHASDVLAGWGVGLVAAELAAGLRRAGAGG